MSVVFLSRHPQSRVRRQAPHSPCSQPKTVLSMQQMAAERATHDSSARKLSKAVRVDSKKNVDEFVREFCEQRPLLMFTDRKIGTVDISFGVEWLKHDIWSATLQDGCCCTARSIDEGCLADIAMGIRSRLIGGSG